MIPLHLQTLFLPINFWGELIFFSEHLETRISQSCRSWVSSVWYERVCLGVFRLWVCSCEFNAVRNRSRRGHGTVFRVQIEREKRRKEKENSFEWHETNFWFLNNEQQRQNALEATLVWSSVRRFGQMSCSVDPIVVKAGIPSSKIVEHLSQRSSVIYRVPAMTASRIDGMTAGKRLRMDDT